MPMTASQNIDFIQRRIDYLDNECVVARYRFNDEQTAAIMESGADTHRGLLERAKANLHGAK